MYKQQVIMGVEVLDLSSPVFDEAYVEVTLKMKGVDDRGFVKEWEQPFLQIPAGTLDKFRDAISLYYDQKEVVG